MARRAALFLGACSLLLAAPLAAQGHAQTREGFYATFGLGAGSAGVSCNGCATDRESAASMYVNMGGTVRPNLLIGGEISGWTKSDQGVDETISSLMAVAHYYPAAKQGFFLSGGLGYTMMKLDDSVDEVKSAGVGMQVGAGFDWRVANTFSLTPYAQYVRAFGAEAKVNGTSSGSNANPNVLQVGLGFTWH